jgi:hypothetical protein
MGPWLPWEMGPWETSSRAANRLFEEEQPLESMASPNGLLNACDWPEASVGGMRPRAVCMCPEQLAPISCASWLSYERLYPHPGSHPGALIMRLDMIRESHSEALHMNPKKANHSYPCGRFAITPTLQGRIVRPRSATVQGSHLLRLSYSKELKRRTRPMAPRQCLSVQSIIGATLKRAELLIFLSFLLDFTEAIKNTKLNVIDI